MVGEEGVGKSVVSGKGKFIELVYGGGGEHSPLHTLEDRVQLMEPESTPSFAHSRAVRVCISVIR